MSVFPSFFFNNPAPTEIYTLSLHDALPILRIHRQAASNRHMTEEIACFERNCLCDTLRPPIIYPLLHPRVRRELRLADGRRSLQWPVQAFSSYIRRYAAAFTQLRRVRQLALPLTLDKAD